MALTIPPSAQKSIQVIYRELRKLYRNPDVPRACAVKAFEELLHPILDEHCWLPTHVSPAAVIQLAERYKGKLEKSVQRAHGILPTRKDRNVRTAELLEGPELPLEEWWAKFIEGDSTILITKQEHGANKPPSDLIPIPEGLFCSQGKSYKWRDKGGKEQPWLSEHYTALTGRQSPWAVEAAKDAEKAEQKAQAAAKKAQSAAQRAAKRQARGR